MSRLKSFIERIERMHEEKRAIESDIKDIYAEAKAEGLDAKIMREVVKIRAKEPNEIQERNALLEAYLNELGQAELAPSIAPSRAYARDARDTREAISVHEAGPPAASPEDGAANQAGHDAEPAKCESIHKAANDRKSSPAQTGEAVTANAGTEAPPVSVSPGREPYTPTPIKSAPKDEDIGIPAFLRRGDPECIVQAGVRA